MTTGRAFLAGIVFVGCDLVASAPARAQAPRRQVVVSGKRAKVVDVHAHCAVPEALALMSPHPWTKTAVDHVLATPGLGDEDKLAVLGGTAMKLLGIKA
jgi:hypothetical protein